MCISHRSRLSHRSRRQSRSSRFWVSLRGEQRGGGRGAAIIWDLPFDLELGLDLGLLRGGREGYLQWSGAAWELRSLSVARLIVRCGLLVRVEGLHLAFVARPLGDELGPVAHCTAGVQLECGGSKLRGSSVLGPSRSCGSLEQTGRPNARPTARW